MYSCFYYSREFWDGIQYNDKLLDIFLDTLKSSQFKSFFFETPSVTSSLLENKVNKVCNSRNVCI